MPNNESERLRTGRTEAVTVSSFEASTRLQIAEAERLASEAEELLSKIDISDESGLIADLQARGVKNEGLFDELARKKQSIYDALLDAADKLGVRIEGVEIEVQRPRSKKPFTVTLYKDRVRITDWRGAEEVHAEGKGGHFRGVNDVEHSKFGKSRLWKEVCEELLKRLASKIHGILSTDLSRLTQEASELTALSRSLSALSQEIENSIK